MENFTRQVIETIQSIPKGKVATYGQVAMIAGNPRGARQVSRILHSMSLKHNLPWHRVINVSGKISLPAGRGREKQKTLLKSEGITFDEKDRVDFIRFGWQG